MSEATSSAQDSTASDPTGGTGVDPDTSGTTGDEPLPELVVWYEFENKLGRAIVDSTENGIDLSCPTCSPFSPGAVGQAVALTGAADSVAQASHDPALEIPEITVALWVLFDEPPHTASLVSKPLGSESQNSWQLFTTVQGTQTVLHMFVSTDAGELSATKAFTAVEDQWHHLAGTFDGQFLRAYVDGEPSDPLVVDHELVYDENPLLVGVEDNADGYEFHFSGAIDDVRIYRRALTPAEIVTLFD